MKKFLGNSKVRFVACIMLALFSVSAVLSGVWLFIVNFEFNGGGSGDKNDYYLSNTFKDSAKGVSEDIVNIITTEDNPDEKLNEKYSSDKTNIIFHATAFYNDFLDSFKNSDKYYLMDTDARKYYYTVTKRTYKMLGTNFENELFVYLTVTIYMPQKLEVKDEFYYGYNFYNQSKHLYYYILFCFVFSAAALILLTVFLACRPANRDGLQAIKLNAYDRLPIEVPLLFVIVPLVFAGSFGNVAGIILTLLSGIALFLLLKSLSVRIRSKMWYKNTLILKILPFVRIFVLNFYKTVKRCFLKLPFIFRAVIIFVLYIAVNLLLIFFNLFTGGFWIFPVLISAFNIFIFIVFCFFALKIEEIKDISKEISQGNFSRETNVKNMPFGLREIAENLNNIGEAYTQSVESARKSERMKAELITNVSHDIKTPLTSIISYVDLLKKESIQNEKAVEYIEVIDRQSAKLKKLTSDLIEASKASTGNINVEFSVIDISEFINQALGEYREKFAQNSLDLIVTAAETPVFIKADGRLLWRILDNLLGNACKYSQENTRVYVSLIRREGKTAISVKNISRDCLNISADELIERFVRGDSSRNTEGSGLGLSIAKSLAELQNAKLKIEIECDMFKAEVIFDEIETLPQSSENSPQL